MIHYLKVDRPIPAPNASRISGPVVFVTACGAAFPVGSAGTDIRSKVTCQACLDALKAEQK